jgi:PAS domain S-box-containing protein
MADPLEPPHAADDTDDFDREIRAVLQRIAASQASNLEAAASESTVGTTSHELLLMLETLRVAEEELRAQNEALELVQDRLADERQRYVELFEGAPDAMLETDPAGVMRSANAAAGDLFGYAAEMLCGKPLAVFFEERERARFRELLASLRQGDRRGEWVSRVRPRGRDPFPVALTVRAERAPSGAPLRLRWAVRDVTGRVHADGDASG